MKIRITVSILFCITGALVGSLVTTPARAATAGMVVRPPAAGFLNGSISVGGLASCGIRTPSDTIFCWGDDTYGQLDGTPSTSTHLGSPPGGGTFTQVSAGNTHTCGIRTNGAVLCWGDDTYGEIDGVPNSSTYQGSPPGGGQFSQISAGNRLPSWRGQAGRIRLLLGALTSSARSTASPQTTSPYYHAGSPPTGSSFVKISASTLRAATPAAS